MSFFEELKRRNVFKVGIAYLVGAWLLLQFTEVLSELLNLPETIGPVVVAIVAIGFPVAIFFAWAFELTPEGIKREEDVDRSQSITPQTGKKLNNAILVLMALAISYLLFDKFSTPGEMGSEPFSQETAQQADEQTGEKRALTPAVQGVVRQSIAVLPFDNRSRNVDDEYFTEGIHDDLLANLARISSLKVISRTSVNKYRETEKTIPEIADELGVATIMEGAVQRSGSTVRINVQLIDAKTDEHLWAEIFDRELSTENLFAIQSEISEKIAHALEATLSPEEEQRINDFPTQSMEAYNAYLRGRQLLPQRNSSDLEQAMEAFELAVELDPQFALAWVGLAESANLLEAHGSLNPDRQNEIMQSAINRALEINPNLGEAYTSKGSRLDDLGQTQEAEAAYKRAIELSPNYATTYQWYALLIGDTNDRLQEALDLNIKAGQLDPLSPIIRQNKAGLYQRMGRFNEAESEFRQLLAANPDFSSAMVNIGLFLYADDLWQIDEAIKLAQNASRVDPGKIGSLVVEHFYWSSLGDDVKVRSVYQQMERLAPDSHWLPVSKAWVNIRQGRYAAAKEEAMFLGRNFSNPFVLRLAGEIFANSGDFDRAREFLFRVEPRYLDREQWHDVLNEGDTDACLIGLSLARTGEEALGRDLLSFAANYWEQTAPRYIEHADRYPAFACYAYMGDVEKSLAALQTSLTHQHVLNDWLFIAANPELSMLHEDPRFASMDQQARAELTRQREDLARIEAEAGP